MTPQTYVNPHLRCGACGAPAPGYTPKSPAVVANEPCGHIAGVSSGCITWSPKSGCGCTPACEAGSLR